MNTIATVSRPRWLSIVGILGIVCMGFTVWLGLWVTPPDQVQGNLARLLYIHPAIATVALYWAGGVALAGSLLYLWPRTRSFFRATTSFDKHEHRSCEPCPPTVN